ncbi:MAG: undecaprenyl-diphosphate phosphatase [Acidobacteriota bacterium]
MDLLGAALLGVVQGLTEFLPVSSSGHLILARAFFGWEAGRFGLAFDVACHVGTLVAVAAYFRREVAGMIAATPDALRGRGGDAGRLVRLVVVGTVPIVAVALVAGEAVEGARSPGVVAVTLALGAGGLLAAERWGAKTRGMEGVGYGGAVAIGVAQAAALIPGVSRSGATITVAMWLGLARANAARFVFLLSLPAVAAAAVREAIALGAADAGRLPAGLFATGFLVSAVVGYVTIKFFLRYLASQSLAVFAYYRFALAGVTAAWLWAR